MNTKRKKTGRKLLAFLLALAMVVGLVSGMSLTAYAETSDTGIEVLITDISCEHYKDKTTSFTTDDGLANISFSATPVFDENYGWYNPNGDLTITVTAANEDYPLSKCMFQCDRPGREDNTDPFEVTISHGGDWNKTTATINGESELSGGLRNIGFFSLVTPDYTALSDGMLIKLGDSIIPGDYYYKTAEHVDTDNPEDRADFKKNTLYTLVKGNIERRQVDPSHDPDWYDDVFVESNDGDHYAFLQVAEKRYIFDGAWTITNHADGLLVTEDTSRNTLGEPVPTYSFSVHEKVFNDATVDGTIENGSIEIKDSEGTAISEAEAGSTVTLDVSADEGYKLKEISVEHLEVQSVSELMEMMGNTKYYADPNNTEYSDYYMATEDGIKLLGFNNNEKAFLSKTAELDKSKSAEGVYTASGKYIDGTDIDITWKFTVKKGKIIAIAPVMNEKEYPTKIESTGTIAEPTYASVELTPVTTGEQYTFTMPATDVIVNATFASKEASVVTKAPEAKTLTYNGSAQQLVNAGEATGGKLQYALGTKDAATGTYYASIPTATDAGTYYVWYKVVGDGNHNDTEPACVPVTIAEEKKDEQEPTPAPTPTPTPGAEIVPSGSGHVQTYGDVAAKASGAGIVIGTTGEAKRLEQFTVSLPKDTDGGIEYRAHLQRAGWGDWVEGGKPCGTTNEARRMEAVQMRLTGALAKTHAVWYRVHSQTWAWLGWARDGQAAGTSGQAKRAEAVEVQVLPQGQVPEGYVESEASYVGAVSADVHLQKIGWTGTSSALEFGTTGQARRLEAVRLSGPATPVAGGISYEAHVQREGWMPAAADGAQAGTTGQARRLEAVRISLTGEAAKEDNYSVWYRVHSQTYGWLGWAHDGQEAGTTGLAKRAEAIDVQVLPQGQVPRGYDASRAACVNG